MKKLKRSSALLIALCMAFSMTVCGGSGAFAAAEAPADDNGSFEFSEFGKPADPAADMIGRIDDAFEQLQRRSMPYLNMSQRLAYAEWFLESGKQTNQAVQLLEEMMEEDPDNEQVNRYMARAYYASLDYVRASTTYENLYKRYPEKPSYALNYAITLSKNERFEEAVQILYQLDFEHPSQHVTRGLAWALMGQRKLEQAEREYNKLLASSPATIDYLNAGYCQWFKGDIPKAISLFRTFLKQHRDVGDKIDLRDEMENDCSMLRIYGISNTDKGIFLRSLFFP